ncbi:MAG: hypothetical protein HON90_10905, partial [Halobacteriovoraceae bacterium]|nr:hypothetical protein [Halobacteriovoraceae bacterium]
SDHNFQFRHIKDKYLAMVGKNPKKPLFDKDTIQWMMDNGITGHRILKNVSTAKGKELNALEVEAAELADKLKKAITKETDLSRHANKSKDGVASIHERDIIDLKKAKEERNVIEKRLREVKNIKDPLREELRLEIVSKKDFIRNSLNIGKDNPQLADADWRKFENLSAKDLAKRGLTGDEIDELLVDKTIPGITNLRSLTDEIRLAEETLAQNKLILEQFKPKKSASAGRIQVKNSDKTREIQINKSDEFSPEETQKLIRFQNDDLELRIQELQLARLPYRRREVSWAKKQNEFRENQRIRHKAIQTEKETIQKRIDENKNHLWSDEYRDITQIVNNLRRSGGSYSWRKPDSSYITIYNDRSLNTSDEAQSLIAKLQNIVSNKSVIEAVISEDELALKTITDEADQIQKLLKEQGYPIK